MNGNKAVAIGDLVKFIGTDGQETAEE